MKFALNGGTAIGTGIGNIFKAAAMAPMYRQQAEQEAGLSAARMMQATNAGRKYGAEADSQEYTNRLRTELPDRIKATTNPYERTLLDAYHLTGDNNIERYAKAGTQFQTQDFRNQAAAAPDITTANKLVSIGDGKPYLPYDIVGTSGYSLDKATGTQIEANPVMAKIFDKVQNSIASENYAQAGAANALRDERTGGGTGKAPTVAQQRENANIDAARDYVANLPRETVAALMNRNPMELTTQQKDMLARITKARTAKYGEPEIPEQYSEAFGLDPAIVQKVAEAARNPGMTTPNAVMKWFGAKPEQIPADEAVKAVVSKLPIAEAIFKDQYIATGKMKANRGDKNPATPSAQPKIKGVPDGYRIIGTSGGKPVFEAPNGERYISE